MENLPLPRLYKYPDVMAMLGISRSALHLLVKEGQIKTVNVGRAVRFTNTELERFLSSLTDGKQS
jgi:excisionase family DNA binding protein